MEVSVRQELNALVEQLTHSGAAELNQERMKRVKEICRSSELYVRALYDLVMDGLKEKHAEIRLSAFQIAKEIFPKSHVFRELLISEFQKFARLVTGTDSHYPLPLPKPAAALLKKQSLLAIREWNVKFGEGYPKLKLGFNFLKHTKKVNFAELVAQSEAARRRREEREARQRAVTQQRGREIATELRDMKGDIEDCMRQMEACFNLLLPRYDLPDPYSSSSPATAPPSTEPQTGDLGRLQTGGTAPHPPPPLSPPPPAGDTCTNSKTLENISSSLQMHSEASKVGRVFMPRRRTLSSGSFVSLGSSDAESMAGDISEEEQQNFESKIRDDSKTDGSVGNESLLESVYGASSQHEAKKPSVASNPVKGKGRANYSSDGGDGVMDEGGDSVMGKGGEGVKGEDGNSDSDESDTDWEEVPSSRNLSMQEHGISSRTYSIPIEIPSRPEIIENDDNSSILTTLRECHQLLLQQYLPAVVKWLEWLTKSGEHDEKLREAIDLKHKLMSTNDKFRKLHIVYKSSFLASKKDDDAGIETLELKPKPVARSNPQWKIQAHSAIPVESELDPTTPQAQIAKLRQKYGLSASLLSPSPSPSASKTTPSAQPGPTSAVSCGATTTAAAVSSSSSSSSSKAEGLRARAPVVPFGMDLYHWETPDDYQPTPLAAQVGSLHRFWVEEREVNLSEDEKARMKCRAITFAGQFEPVSRSCRAPLPSGKLCPRKDRVKCPFHGPIIPRDERGNPVAIESTSSDPSPSHPSTSGGAHSSSLPSGSQPNTTMAASADTPELWREIESDIMAAKGLELMEGGKRRGKGKGGRRDRTKKYPGLTDLKKHVDTPRKRLEKKVLSKRALRSVADSMDALTAKKYQDKFGYNFNYALRS